jgi:hypothetical protein
LRGCEPKTCRKKGVGSYALEEETSKKGLTHLRRTVMKKYLIAGLLVAGFVTPAFAAEYYVAQNNSTHKCSIVSKKPDGKMLTMLGSEAFKTKSAAESALKGMTECKA